MAFRNYVTVTRQGPEPDGKKYREHKPTPLRPNQPAYWRKRGEQTLGIGHGFSCPYCYHDLLRRTRNDRLKTE